MSNRLFKIFLEEKGNVAIITALVFTILLASAGFAVDYGVVFMERRKMVTAADAGALAGARILWEGQVQKIDRKDEAENVAEKIAILNGAAPGMVTAEVIASYPFDGKNIQAIEVKVGVTSETYFAKLFNVNIATIMARAVGTWGYINNVDPDSFFPLYLESGDYTGDAGALPLRMEDDTPSNWGIFDMSPGKDDYKDALRGDEYDLPDINLFKKSSAFRNWLETSGWSNDESGFLNQLAEGKVSLTSYPDLVNDLYANCTEFIYQGDQGKVNATVQVLDKDVGQPKGYGRLKRHYDWQQNYPNHDYTALEGYVPVVARIGESGNTIEFVLLGFVPYQIHDVVTNKTAKNLEGSVYSIGNGIGLKPGRDPVGYENRGNKNDEYNYFDGPYDLNEVNLDKGSIIGRLLGLLDLREDWSFLIGGSVEQEGIGVGGSFLIE